ncbi:MAG: hypothetical protein P4M14_13420 [Gammaproteobacteria bacterium]|nr:hypothetical protein [Gammaproteobacteria bacterium]
MQHRLEEYKESNTSPSAYLQGWSYATSLGVQYQDTFIQIPKQYYPDNPANEGFFPTGKTGLAKQFTDHILPLIPLFSLIASWINTAKTINRYYYETNKNYDNTLDLVVNVLTSAATTVFWGLLLLGGATTSIIIAPYFLVSALGLGVLYGIYGVIKRVCDAAGATTPEAKSIHHWEIWKQSITFVVNLLAFATTLAFGIQIGPKLSKAAALLQEAVRQWDFGKLTSALVLVEAAGNAFRGGKTLYYTFTAFLTLGVATSAWELNTETLHMLANPDVLFDDMKAKYLVLKETIEKQSPAIRFFAVLAAVPLVLMYVAVGAVNAISRALALVFVGPLQLFLKSDAPLPVQQPVAEQKEPDEHLVEIGENHPVAIQEEGVAEIKAEGGSAQRVMHLLQGAQKEEHAALCREVDQKLAALNDEMKREPSTKRQDKIDFLTRIKNEKLSPAVESYNAETPMNLFVKEAGSLTWQSFWRRVGQVEKIANTIWDYDQKWYPKAPR